MHILILVSSLRKHGNTDQIVDLLVEDLRVEAILHKEPLEIEKLYLGDHKIAPCLGCRSCFDRGEESCPLKDDLLEIKAKMKNADGLIVASPVYVDDVNGVMKNWIDRLAHVCHRPEFAGKSAYLLVTVGSTRSSHAIRTLDTALRTWGFHIVGKAGFKTHAKMELREMRNRYQQRTAKTAEAIFAAIRRKQFSDPSFISLMIFRIQQIGWSRSPREHLDYQYWAKQGWLDPGQTFFINPKANGLKVVSARLVGSILAKFMT